MNIDELKSNGASLFFYDLNGKKVCEVNTGLVAATHQQARLVRYLRSFQHNLKKSRRMALFEKISLSAIQLGMVDCKRRADPNMRLRVHISRAPVATVEDLRAE